jgi:hypothetical protein
MLERSIYLTDEADSSQKPGSGKPFSNLRRAPPKMAFGRQGAASAARG